MDISSFYSILFGLLAGGIITVYKDNINRKNYVIDKDKIRRLSKLNIKNIPSMNVKGKYSTDVEYFNNVIKTKLPFVNLTYFYKNIEDLVINEKEYLGEFTNGGYNSYSNIMFLLLNDKGKSINHELLHLSSAIINGKIKYVGFSQQSEGFNIGDGINEGYTSILDKRYFNTNSESYILYQQLGLLIEKIIGQEKMTKMYFEADLYGLIEELSKYCYKDTAYELIKNIDFLFKKTEVLNVDEFSETEIAECKQISERITEILFSCYVNKLKSSVQENLITIDELFQFLSKFSSNLAFQFNSNNLIIDFLTDEIFEKNVKLHFPKEKYNLSCEIKEENKSRKISN